MITKFGKRFLTSAIAGVINFNAKDIAVGIAGQSDYAISDTNSRLGFEFFRLPVMLGSMDIADDGNGGYTYTAIYKTTIPQDISGTIKEIALYPGARYGLTGFDSKLLTDFEDTVYWSDSLGNKPDLLNSTESSPRIGEYMAEWKFDIGDTTSGSKEYRYPMGAYDLSGYSVNDTLDLSFNKIDTNSSKIRIKFYSSDTDYVYGDIDISSLSVGGYIKNVPLADVFNNVSGTPDLAMISYIGVEVYRASTSSDAIVHMDGLRINDEDTFDPAYGMVSRSILSTPIVKVSGKPIDIEYKLTLEF